MKLIYANKFKIRNGRLIVDGKVLYPENTIIFNRDYCGAYSQYLDSLKAYHYMVDTYACDSSFLQWTPRKLSYLSQYVDTVDMFIDSEPKSDYYIIAGRQNFPFVSKRNVLRGNCFSVRDTSCYLDLGTEDRPYFHGLELCYYMGYLITFSFFTMFENKFFVTDDFDTTVLIQRGDNGVMESVDNATKLWNIMNSPAMEKEFESLKGTVEEVGKEVTGLNTDLKLARSNWYFAYNPKRDLVELYDIDLSPYPLSYRLFTDKKWSFRVLRAFNMFAKNKNLGWYSPTFIQNSGIVDIAPT